MLCARHENLLQMSCCKVQGLKGQSLGWVVVSASLLGGMGKRCRFSFHVCNLNNTSNSPVLLHDWMESRLGMQETATHLTSLDGQSEATAKTERPPTKFVYRLVELATARSSPQLDWVTVRKDNVRWFYISPSSRPWHYGLPLYKGQSMKTSS